MRRKNMMRPYSMLKGIRGDVSRFLRREALLGGPREAQWHKFTSHVYREMAFGSISGCIRGDVANIVNAGIHHVSGSLCEIYDN